MRDKLYLLLKSDMNVNIELQGCNTNNAELDKLIELLMTHNLLLHKNDNLITYQKYKRDNRIVAEEIVSAGHCQTTHPYKN